jgi:predicted ATP-grasp superfamily ATP-dependent carboligase
MGPPVHTTPPILLLGGEANALSVARELGREGIPVFAVGEPDAAARHSRYCRWIDLPTAGDPETAWADFLLGPASDHLRGAPPPITCAAPSSSRAATPACAS